MKTPEPSPISTRMSIFSSRISAEVSGKLGGIIEQVRKLDSLVAEIAQASSEQSQGIEQVNTTVTQIDKITQANAAAAEESAAAAEELTAQAAELNNLVGNLLTLVGAKRAAIAPVRESNPFKAAPAKAAPMTIHAAKPARVTASAVSQSDQDAFFR